MKRYKPSLINTQKPWPHLDVKLLEASMAECEEGDYIKYLPIFELASEMKEEIECDIEWLQSLIAQCEINELALKDIKGRIRRKQGMLAEARGEL